LLHFVLVGLLLFGVYRYLHPDTGARDMGNRIVLTEDDLRQMSVQWIAQGRPPPTPSQWNSLIETKVREEVLYREALAMGLDRDDTIVKRRMAQKMEFLAEDLSGLVEPTPEVLKVWFAANQQRFATPPRVTFRHVYFSPDRRGPRAHDDAASALRKLTEMRPNAPEIAALGDAFMFQDYYGDKSFDQIATQFGPQFAQSLIELQPGRWQGPIESGYGWHLVLAESITPPRVPNYEEVEADVKAEWIAANREEMKRKMFETMQTRYQVVLPKPSAPEARPPSAAATSAAPPATTRSE
jgi:peptidyl-prolyl cis-trans isomerase C